MSLEIYIWNVLHGLAVTIVTPNRKLVAYDAGRSEAFSPLGYLKSRGWERLDYFFLSHPHADHLRDIESLVALAPRTIWRPRPPEQQIREAAHGVVEEKIVDRYERELDQRYIWPATEDPQDPVWGGGTYFRIFEPPVHANINNMSLVVFVCYGEFCVLLSGDLEKEGWLALLGDDDFKSYLMRTTVLLAPHHGREAGVCREGFQYLSPRLCVISDGHHSATSAGVYSELASGARVTKNGLVYERRALSTRKDGHVAIRASQTSFEVELT
jgi:competence protein ComEC